jgi:murein DD-endopeptidase MepM/ murein hydrolase activator NlpD
MPGRPWRPAPGQGNAAGRIRQHGINAGTDACKPDDVYKVLTDTPSWTPPLDMAVRGLTSRVPWRVEENKAVGTHGYTRNDPPRGRKFHAGTDLLADAGEQVKAVTSGKVIAAVASASLGALGNYVILRTSVIVPPALPCAVDIVYAHLQSVSVTGNQQVTAGAVLGKAGRSGNLDSSIPTHLHIELWASPYKRGAEARVQLTRDIMKVFPPGLLGAAQ